MAPSAGARGMSLAKQEGAVKPRGGTWISSGDLDRPMEKSKLDALLNNYVEEATQRSPGNAGLYHDIMNKKARKYFQNEYGTANDPLRLAITKGEIPLFGRDVEKLPAYLTASARTPTAPGHEMAKRHLEKAYDEAADIRASLYNPQNEGSYALKDQTAADVRQKLEQEGVPLEFQNQPPYTSITPSDIENYPSSSAQIKSMLEQQNIGVLPPHLARAMQQSDVMYDVGYPGLSLFKPNEVGQGIAALDPNKLKNMSFDQMLIEGAKKLEPVRDYTAAIEKAASGAQVPKEVLFKFTQPVLDTDAGKWVELTNSLATKMEGKLMKHSVGGYAEGESYGTAYTGLPYGGKKAFDEGLVKVFSLRNEKGYPTTTLEMAKTGLSADSPWQITQIRGKFNSQPPEKEFESIFKFLEQQPELRIKPNSYHNDARGESTRGTQVNWEKAYDDYRFNPGSEYTDAITEF